MKYTVITLATAFALGLASCGGGSNSDTLTQEQLDSAKTAFDDSLRLVEQAKNDSITLANAQREADSLKAVNDSLAKVANKKVTTVTKKQNQKPATSTNNQVSAESNNTAVEVVAPAKNEKSTSNRPGAKNQSSTQSASSSSENIKSTSNRPGAK